MQIMWVKHQSHDKRPVCRICINLSHIKTSLYGIKILWELGKVGQDYDNSLYFFHPQLPEQYRIDPPSLESKHHHKRKKHKRKAIEKAAEDGGDTGPPAAKAKMPSDAFTFIKHEPPHSHYPSPQAQLGHSFSGSSIVQTTSVIQHSYSTSMGGGRRRHSLSLSLLSCSLI